MKRKILSVCAAFSLFTLLQPPAPAMAGEAITYDDAAAGTGAVRQDITLHGVLYGDSFFAGTAASPSASGNTVTVDYVWGSPALDPGSVFGGVSDSQAVTGNVVNFMNGLITKDVFGGYDATAAGLGATGNQVKVTGGTFGGDIFGGHSLDGAAAGNTISFASGTIGGTIYGGYVYQNSGSASGNTVNISSGIVGGDIHGGFVYLGSGSASGNTLNISGGTINSAINGGYINSGGGAATGNTIVLSGSPNFGNAVKIYGGAMNAGASDLFTGNTLQVMNVITKPVGEIGNFQYYRFRLPNSPGGPAMLTSGSIDLTDGGSRVAEASLMGIAGGGPNLNVGDRFVLLDSGSAINGSYTPNTQQIKKGVTTIYNLSIDLENSDHQLVATVIKGESNDHSEALSKGRLSGVAAVNQGGDLLAGHGISAALAAALSRERPGSLSTFGVVGGSSSRYETGSHVDVDGAGLATGLAWQAPLADNSFLLGIFFEAGWGDYDSYNSFSGQAEVRGSGDTRYCGGGIFGRYDFTNGSPSGFYTEASFRAGQLKSDFYSSDLTDVDGNAAAYDSKAAYWGGHGGLGYGWAVNEAAKLDFSTKFLWTRQGGDQVIVTGDPVQFKASDSLRWRNGAQFSYETDTSSGELVTPYIGLYHDFEFDGKSEASAYGLDLPAPKLRGGTGVGDLGLRYKPVGDGGLALDLSVQGYAGRREGFGGNLMVKYTF